MANLTIDTKEMHEVGTNMMKLTNELNEVLTHFYHRLNQMPTTTGEWVGSSALEFVRRANIEKQDYMRLKDELYQSGKILADYSDQLELESSKRRC